jgi:integrase
MFPMPAKPNRKTLVRHVPVKGVSHVYYSERANGTKSYEIRHPRNENKERLYEVVGTGKGALARAKARAREVHATGTVAPASTDTRLAEVYKSWCQIREMKQRSADTFDAVYRTHIEPTLGRRRVRDLNVHAILTWLRGMKRADGTGELASGTKRLNLATLAMILGHAVEMNAIGAVPKLDRKRKPSASAARMRVLTHAEEEALMFAFGRRAWMRPIVAVALGQALRLGEVCGLQWGDVNFDAGTVTIRHNLGRDGKLGTPKGGKPATILLTSKARRALVELHLAAGRPAAGYVIVNSYGDPRQLRDVQRAFAQAVAKAELPVTDHGAVNFHSLRHTAGSRLANAAGTDLGFVRDFMRHSNLAITNTYVTTLIDTPRDERMKEVI